VSGRLSAAPVTVYATSGTEVAKATATSAKEVLPFTSPIIECTEAIEIGGAVPCAEVEVGVRPAGTFTVRGVPAPQRVGWRHPDDADRDRRLPSWLAKSRQLNGQSTPAPGPFTSR
jgi:hypothetical protein